VSGWLAIATETYRNDQALAECGNPIFVPQQLEELLIQLGLVDFHFQRVVGVGVDAKVLDLVHRYGLVVQRAGGWRCVALIIDE